MAIINWSDFEKVDMRVGTIIRVEDFPKARNSAYKVWIDFGDEIGIKKSSAQITKRYKKEDLVDKQLICVVNFPPKQVADFISEVLITGLVLPDGEVILATADLPTPNGTRLL